MVKIAVFISGSGSNLQSLIDAYKNGEIENGEISLVISSSPKAYGLTRAENAGIKAVCEKDQSEILKLLQENDIDLIVLAGYLAIVSDTIINTYQNRIINIHPSLIPAFCGKGFYGIHVHEAAFKRGVKLSGATVHFVSEVVDGGPIIIQRAIDVSSAASPEAMQQMILPIEHQILPTAVKWYCQGKIEVKEERVIIK